MLKSIAILQILLAITDQDKNISEQSSKLDEFFAFYLSKIANEVLFLLSLRLYSVL